MTDPNGATIEYTADDRLREMEALIEQQAERIRSLENELKSCTAELAEALKPPAGLRHPCIVAGEVLGAGNSQARAVVILQDRKAVMRLLETP